MGVKSLTTTPPRTAAHICQIIGAGNDMNDRIAPPRSVRGHRGSSYLSLPGVLTFDFITLPDFFIVLSTKKKPRPFSEEPQAVARVRYCCYYWLRLSCYVIIQEVHFPSPRGQQAIKFKNLKRRAL